MDKKIFRPNFSTATDARVVQTREALRRALLELLAVKSLEQITIREITAVAGVGYTTFFRHHPTKETLLEDIAADEIQRLIELALEVFDGQNIQAASFALCNYVAEHKTLWSTLLTGGAAGALRAEFIRICRELAATWPPYHDWLPAEVGIILAASSTIELLAWWLKQQEPISVQQLATIFERVVVAPIASQGMLNPAAL